MVDKGQAVEPDSKEETSIDLAYQFVLPSYDWMLNRLAAVETRIQSLLIMVSTVTAAFPLVVVGLTGESQHLNGTLAIAAFACFVVCLLLGLVARAFWTVHLVNPGKFDAGWTERAKDDFRTWAVVYAGKHYAKNKKLIAHKSYLADASVIVFLAELALWTWWAKNVLGI